MGSAVSSIFGGGGSGGILGALGGIVGGIFGGPIGAMIGQAIGGMLQQAVGNAFNGAVDNMVKEHGMPKFLGDEVKARAGEVLGGIGNGSPSHEAQQIAHDRFGGAINRFEQNLTDTLTGLMSDAIGKKGTAGKTSAKGWIQAIAEAMGKALGDKAKEMVKLSDEISSLAGSGAETTAQMQGKKGEELGQLQSKKQDQAQEFNMKMTEFQATSQEYNMLNNVFSTAIKSIGESMSSMARKQ